VSSQAHPATTQSDYYTLTADTYDADHFDEPEHDNAIAWLKGLIIHHQLRSLLDVGAGTGRVVRKLNRDLAQYNLNAMGIEPVQALREQGYAAGIPQAQLIEGNGDAIPFPAESFDVVCQFAVLHHVAEPGRIVAEMLRVARVGIFMSDMNNFGCGGLLARSVKQTLNTLGLWRTYRFVRTMGKGYKVGKRDGLRYSYSVYNNYAQIGAVCKEVFVMNTAGHGVNPYRTCPHVALFARK
jgi:ubiquinone/menaquinone biosynthesis C-methylase UbiE